jgi:hypothetical protein
LLKKVVAFKSYILLFPPEQATVARASTILGCAARPKKATQCPHVLSWFTTNRDELMAALHIAGHQVVAFTDPLAAWGSGG